MSTSTFHCANPDFSVKSLRDGTTFPARKSALATGSDVFNDMFSCCDAGYDLVTMDDITVQGSLELDETSETLTVLLSLLHEPPPPVVIKKDTEAFNAPSIPLPLLPQMFRLADKYALSDTVVKSLHGHLLAQAPISPLKVYGLSLRLGLEGIANKASRYLVHPSVTSYTDDEINEIPTVAAYHKLARLQAFRRKQLREILRGEEIFPYNYGVCPAHAARTKQLWEKRKKALFPYVESGTEVAAEMAKLLGTLSDCKTCLKACAIVVDMLAYKCNRVPKTVDRIPQFDE